MTGNAPTSIGRLAPLVADLACVLVFAVAGKGSHEPGASSWVVAAIVWPYAVAVALTHAGLRWRGRPPRRIWPEGVVVVTVTYLLGMLLRVVSGRGIAVGFLVVAVVFLALTMLGWRTIASWVVNRRTPPAR